MPAIPTQPQQGRGMYQEPTIFQKLKMGAMMGAGVGLCIGLVFGTVSILRYGPGQKGYLGTMGQYMGSSAASFAFFMAIGTVIRTEEAHQLTFQEHQRLRSFRQQPLPLDMRARYTALSRTQQ
ncbi:subunit of TIM23 translocase complex [Sorochytrium milnesiophthora]